MTGSTRSPTTPALPPGVQISFNDKVTRPEGRQAAIRSIATLATRSAEAVARAREVEAGRIALSNALNAPLKKLVEEDSGVSQGAE